MLSTGTVSCVSLNKYGIDYEIPCIMAQVPPECVCTHHFEAVEKQTDAWPSSYFSWKSLQHRPFQTEIARCGTSETTLVSQNNPDACRACVSPRKVTNKRARTNYSTRIVHTCSFVSDSLEMDRVRSGNSCIIPTQVILWPLSGMSALYLGGTSAPSRHDSRESDRV